MEQTRQALPTVTFRSPFDGVVIDKQAVKGMHVTPGQTLYKLADLSVVWLEADVYENDIRQVRLGAQGAVTLDAYPNERFTGRAVYIGSSMDEKTRTVKVRFSLVNRADRLTPGMYANVELNEAAAARSLDYRSDAAVGSRKGISLTFASIARRSRVTG